MKLKAQIKAYYQKRIRKITALFELPTNAFTVEDYHQVRVEIKKLTSIHKMLNATVSGYKSKKHLSPLKRIFKAAGNLRETQLEASFLAMQKGKYPVATLESYLEEKEKAETAAYFATVDKNRKTILKNDKSFLLFLKKLKRKKMEIYFIRKSKEIDSLVKEDGWNPSSIHEYRRRIKTYRYTLKSGKLAPRENEMKKLNVLQELAGKWHDSQVMADHFNNAMSFIQMNKTEWRNLKKIISILKKDADKFFQQMIAEIKVPK